jgi:methylase of polypeptide subunit release factors
VLHLTPSAVCQQLATLESDRFLDHVPARTGYFRRCLDVAESAILDAGSGSGTVMIALVGRLALKCP